MVSKRLPFFSFATHGVFKFISQRRFKKRRKQNNVQDDFEIFTLAPRCHPLVIMRVRSQFQGRYCYF